MTSSIFSKVEAGQMRLFRRGRPDIGRCAQQLPSPGSRTRRNHRRQRALEDRTGVCPQIRGDELKLKQICLNLFSNAIKFTPADGDVEVSARMSKAGELEIQFVDTGIGIDRDQIPMIMQPFRQVENPMSRKFEGTGLGLPPGEGPCRTSRRPAGSRQRTRKGHQGDGRPPVQPGSSPSSLGTS